LYIETSGRRSGQNARLISPTVTVQAGQQMCVSFWYDMYGSHIDKLNIYVRNTATTQLGSPVWSRQRTQGNRWIQGQFSLTQQGALNVSLRHCINSFCHKAS